MREAPEGASLPTQSLIAVAGPTASGKTELALRLARALDGEIVSCDSRQVYRYLAAGTDKPQGGWEDGRYVVEGVPYHLVDFLEPDETFSAGEFVRRAQEAIARIRARKRVPVLAGGTGLYLRALLDGLDPLPAADAAIRERLRAEADKDGRPALHARLAKVDPKAAAGIPANNIHRVIRALEVHELTGKPISSYWTRTTTTNHKPRTPNPLVVGIKWPKAELDARIAARCRAVFPAMLEETQALLDRGVAPDAPALLSIGYPEAVACLRGGRSQEAALETYARTVQQYAKRQRTWFRTAAVRWLEPPVESAVEQVMSLRA